MKLSSIANMISGELSVTDYSLEIAAELSKHAEGLRTLGGVAQVFEFL
jgi:hypothetical protein